MLHWTERGGQTGWGYKNLQSKSKQNQMGSYISFGMKKQLANLL